MSETIPLVRDSFMFQKVQKMDLFDEYKPDFQTKLNVEVYLDQEHPRPEDDTLLRVFIEIADDTVVGDASESSKLMCIQANNILDSQFGVDRYIENYKPIIDQKRSGHTLNDDEIIFLTFTNLLNYACLTAMGYFPEENAQFTQRSIATLVACVFKEPLDVWIILKKQGNDVVTFENCWAVKSKNELAPITYTPKALEILASGEDAPAEETKH